MNVSIIVPTYGDLAVWGPLAQRAVRSALDQTVECEVLREHGDTLAEARNLGGQRAEGDWLIFLDADDELSPGYVAAMSRAQAPLRQPATLGIVNGRADDEPVVIPPRGRSLLDGNHLIIGTMMPRVEFHAVGGFRDLRAWEDWDLFLRLWLRGLTVEAVPEAVYRVTVKPGSRNDITPREAGMLYRQIRALYTDEAARKGLR